MTIELDTTLAQAEVLFLSFAQLVADVDRRTAEQAAKQPNQLRRRNAGNNPNEASSAPPTVKAPVLSDELRELLQAGR